MQLGSIFKFFFYILFVQIRKPTKRLIFFYCNVFNVKCDNMHYFLLNILFKTFYYLKLLNIPYCFIIIFMFRCIVFLIFDFVFLSFCIVLKG